MPRSKEQVEKDVAKVLKAIRPSFPQSVADITKATGLDRALVEHALGVLRKGGLVLMSGDRRSARYQRA